MNQRLNAYIHILPPIAKSPLLRGPLAGTRIGIKDNIAVHAHPTSCASAILDGYCPPFDATVVKKLRNAGATLTGKTNMDEFAMGSHTIHSHHGVTKQPARNGRVFSAGGSSGGSAVAVATDQCDTALGTDTGGSVRLPAAYCGIIGFKPSYGLLSRYGVVAYANSLDTVGILARSFEDLRSTFKCVSGPDVRDPTCLNAVARHRLDAIVNRGNRQGQSHRLRIGIPQEYRLRELHPTVRNIWLRTAQRLLEMGHVVVPISLPHTQYAPSAYYILGPSEATSNLAKYDGVRYGKRESDHLGDRLYSSSRTRGFGTEVRRRIIIGSYSLSAAIANNYFLQAQRIRNLIRKDFDLVFSVPNPLIESGEELQAISGERVDFVLVPTSPHPPPLIVDAIHQDPLVESLSDVFTIPANLAGIPSVTFPVQLPSTQGPGREEPSTGMQLMGQFGTDEWLLTSAQQISKGLSK